MTRPAASAPMPTRGMLPAFAVLGLACLAVITLASPGATRMFAWPWSLAYAGALVAPTLALVARAFDPRRPLVLPSRPWTLAALAATATVLGSALASPYRGPSLLWSAPLLAALALFFVIVDAQLSAPAHPHRFASLVGLCLAAPLLTSLALWLSSLPGRSLVAIVDARNPFPLGHSNYTAGLALLALPWLAWLAWRAPRTTRIAWAVAAALAFIVFFTSGSRAGVIAFAALALAALLLSPLPRTKKLALTAALAAAALALVFAHPRTRAMLFPSDPSAAPNVSNVQRAAMLTAGARLGADRPLLGWGPGTTPLAYPRYRAGLEGGAENVLQLHNTPAQLWAECGAAGLACALAFALLVLCHARRHPLAAVTLIGYAVFSLGDWQLDVPVFAFALAFFAAQLAAPAASPVRSSRWLGGVALLALAVIALLGRPDPAPELNVRALALARDGTPAHTTEAIALLRQSLALNPDQEIAHFNLGWLLLVRDPAAAEKHFVEALHLVPDKGGVYFGLGLARLNQNRPAEAARAFALECLNDPAFLTSPWWSEASFTSLRAPAAREFTALTHLARRRLPPASWAATQLPRIATLAPLLADVPPGPVRAFRRERTAYPVLMRNLDLPPPLDLYDVREPMSPPATSSPLPAKGWLPSPLLLELLDAPLAPSISH